MYYYSPIWMGPVNSSWAKEHGDHWSGGRIDIDHPSFQYSDETDLPIMHQEDYNRFGAWLFDFASEHKMSFSELRAVYERTNPRLRLFSEVV